ncbi:MAG: hypothetical protein E7414_02855 [Ruminococcaceae bacterium]|nr:hypothetical protein [Oscillospiraceae bacterium]
MKTKATSSIKSITIAGLLTALAIVVPLFMPKLPVPQPFSVTPASHLAVILAMFVSPFTVICTVIGSTIAFFAVLGPVVAMRAFSHIIFALVGCYLIKKRYNLVLIIVVTALLHALGEVAVVFVFSLFGMADAAVYFLWGVTGGITVLHHCFDFVIALVVYKALRMAPGLVELAPVNLKHFKA